MMYEQNKFKPLEEYELHDHGEGDGWQVVTKFPDSGTGLITFTDVQEHEGMIGLYIQQIISNGLGWHDESFTILTPEDALVLASRLKTYGEESEANALKERYASEETKELEEG